MTKSLIPAFFLAAFALACNGQDMPAEQAESCKEKGVQTCGSKPENDREEPPLDIHNLPPSLKNTGAKANSFDAIQATLQNNGRRVLVIFDDVTVKDTTTRCPVKVRTVDDICLDKGYQNIDPKVACRAAGDSSAHASWKKILWKTRTADRFTVTFDGGQMPCDTGWTGGTEDVRHVCRLKNASALGVQSGKSAFFKYNIIGTDTNCPVLDPYFIVRD